MSTEMEDAEAWRFTIVRSQGVHILRSEKGWRPIVTVDVDQHPQHEVQLGTDGQNPNRKLAFELRDVDAKTRIQIKVWQKSMSKKKGKKRNLVATADMCLGETFKHFGHDAIDETELSVRLHSVARQNESRRIRGVCPTASLLVRLQAPPSFSSGPSANVENEGYMSDMHTDHEHGYTTEAITTREPSPAKPEFPKEAPLPPLPESTLRRRRGRTRGYTITADSDEDSCLSDSSSSDSRPPRYSDLDDEPTTKTLPKTPSTDAIYWFMPSILPRFSTDNMSIESHKSRAETLIDSFTPYHELKKAEESNEEKDFERVLDRLRTEWLAVGASLVALAGLDAAVFGFSDDTLFKIDGFAKNMVAMSSIASGVGLFTSAWFLMLYSFQDARSFQRKALDLYGTYFFFCLSCRFPTVCMVVSACSLMLFLFRVAWMTWKTATLVMSFFAGVVVSLQYLVYGVHSFIRLILRLGGASRRLVLRAVARRSTTVADAEVALSSEPKGPSAVEQTCTPVSPFGPRPCAIGKALAEMPVLGGPVTEEPIQEEDVAESGRIPVS